MIEIPAPEPLAGDELAEQIEAAGHGPVDVTLAGDVVQVVPRVDQTLDEAAVRKVVAAHVPSPPVVTPSTDDRLAAIEARLDKAAATPVTGEAAKLRDAIKGGI